MHMGMYGDAVINCLVDNLYEKEMEDFSYYDEETELFSKLFKKKFENPKMFWKFAGTKHPKFSILDMLIAANGRLLIVVSSVEVNGHSLPVKGWVS